MADDWSSYALLVVDIQEDFYTAIPAIPQSFPGFADRVTKLLSVAREKGIEVIHIRAVYEPDVNISPWTKYWAELNPDKKTKVKDTPEPFAKEVEGEKIVVKNTFDGFLKTELDEYLKSKGKTNVVVCGLVTSCCVLMTTAAAFLRGYRTVVVEDCCGDRTVEKHNTIFTIYGAYMFRTSRVNNLIEDLNRWRLSNEELTAPPPTL
eukprot:TRINITY_DN1359_c0_g1_i1.p1 TRINITY_DN1359_c0_g1~~TRINITY_DN1359_c0_g1_i1.p1  ORF type:complete len:206 (-),score=61.61 TRINITY_DN1359_c0_g1_i1:70-687(-)